MGGDSEREGSSSVKGEDEQGETELPSFPDGPPVVGLPEKDEDPRDEANEIYGGCESPGARGADGEAASRAGPKSVRDDATGMDGSKLRLTA